ncbi:Spermidine Putrescine ABC transporter permease component PotB (TC 3.A.1.11.1) [Halorubrum sp. DM2]|uniref:ABC transporter permease n=1 Tax=unclassified Halorubrum TaxID=2642239 RepID=UPI0003DB9786|nr:MULTISPECIES: ABC transporter permease [unclassified Halorubrum]CDK38425.1 spermidine/putrescine ABC transporter permease [Halorubrum sp. AJ67]VTT85949.1 Spermidine Putrescine ABC transporter permease component PotB (TC 3.A.1.11.1) [Halorubrum sp. DM2]
MGTIQKLGDAFERRGERAKLALMVGPGVGWLLTLILIPTAFLVMVSFAEVNQSYDVVWSFSVSNYRELFVGESGWFTTPFVDSFFLSLRIAGATTFLTVVLAYPVAYLLTRLSGRRFKIVLFAVLVPFFTIFIVRIYSWLSLFGSQGLINSALLATPLVSEPLGVFEYGVVAVIISLTHAFFPYMLLTLYSSLEGIDYGVIEASRDLGATRLEIAKDIVIPLSAQGLITGCVFVFVPALGTFITPQFLARGKFTMIAEVLTSRINELYAINYGAAGSLFLIIPTIIAFAIVMRTTSLEAMG